MDAYRYPSKRHRRRQGPQGYQHVGSYRPWLRDEFTFRCVCCLEREQWSSLAGAFDIEHFAPVACAPDLAFEYDNLLYACRSCKAVKGSHHVPNPLRVLLSHALRVEPDGRINGRTKASRKLIDIMRLDDPAYRERRRLLHRILTLAERVDVVLYRSLLGFPEDLPNLARLRPPENIRPEGIEMSYYRNGGGGTMTIENRCQWENTRRKLRELEELYQRKRQEPGDAHVRELTLQSLKRRINRFKEELARFEAKFGVPTEGR